MISCTFMVRRTYAVRLNVAIRGAADCGVGMSSVGMSPWLHSSPVISRYLEQLFPRAPRLCDLGRILVDAKRAGQKTRPAVGRNRLLVRFLQVHRHLLVMLQLGEHLARERDDIGVLA